jgi:DNA-binding PadR family transcriptional regulator
MAHGRSVDPAAFLPLKPAAYLLLVALGEGDAHAYALRHAVARRSRDRLHLGPATLHRTLAYLLDQRLIEESPDRPDPAHDDERRRYYRLTPLGRQVVVAETDRLADLVSAARAIRWGGRRQPAR